MGCARKCSVLAESMQDSHFMIGRDDVITLISFYYGMYVINIFLLINLYYFRQFIVTHQMVEVLVMQLGVKKSC